MCEWDLGKGGPHGGSHPLASPGGCLPMSHPPWLGAIHACIESNWRGQKSGDRAVYLTSSACRDSIDSEA